MISPGRSGIFDPKRMLPIARRTRIGTIAPARENDPVFFADIGSVVVSLRLVGSVVSANVVVMLGIVFLFVLDANNDCVDEILSVLRVPSREVLWRTKGSADVARHSLPQGFRQQVHTRNPVGCLPTPLQREKQLGTDDCFVESMP